MEGYGRYWVIIETLRESANYKLENDFCTLEALADDMKCETEELKTFLDDCVNKFKLLTEDEGFFYSQSLLVRMIKLDEIRQKRSDAAKKRDWPDD